ncbi:hypothetical protein G3N58_29360 [Paraburkholderia sp. Ac-20342]|nr:MULTISPECIES: hypothetical protein [unclassified Paraburkholderia]MBN3850902.1 hypothetical protein [Paraburkholderia sp. Ac-20342]
MSEPLENVPHVPLTDEDYFTLLDGQTHGKRMMVDQNGKLSLADLL